MEEQSSQTRLYKNEDNISYTGVLGFLWEIVKVFVLALVIIIPIRVFLFQPFFVQGASMEPNFEDGEYLIVNELGFKETEVGLPGFKLFTVNSFREFERGDVAVFRYPLKPSQFFIKRIIGLPGETIVIANKQVTIINEEYPDGFVLSEKKYISDNVDTQGDQSVVMKESEYYVMGDNRTYSSDSRAWGPVPKNDVVGRVVFRAWPANKMETY